MTTSQADGDILAIWREFPIQRVPRPVVFLDRSVRIGDGGFVDGQAKVAWLAGSIESSTALPDGLVDVLPSRRPRPDVRTTLVISAVEPCQAEFLCDRGPRLLPAYRLMVSGLRQPCIVLDPGAECWWPPPGRSLRPTGGSATVAVDDQTIHFPAFGGALTEFHRAEFVEYPTCVVGHAVTSERQAPPGTAVHAVGISRMVAGRLSAPLAGRVLLHQTGAPVAVLPDADAATSGHTINAAD